jgi:hypothetical protein
LGRYSHITVTGFPTIYAPLEAGKTFHERLRALETFYPGFCVRRRPAVSPAP